MTKIYNTLTKKKEVFTPIETHRVRMYVCGPTVYSCIHIDNARSAIAFDTIRRYSECHGYEVNYISNFTNVDDKIIETAKGLKVTASEVTERFIKALEKGTQALSVQPATLYPWVIGHIPDILTFIDVSIEKGLAYEVASDVYYHTRKLPNYSKLSHQSTDELEAGASQRIGVERQLKEGLLDFALREGIREDKVSWDSPWGKGRPGWHTECSIVATKRLKETVDIHGGGQDLEFSHHENETAQSKAKASRAFVDYQIHSDYVIVDEDNEKTNKSLDNFITVHEMIQRVGPQILCFFMSTTQYHRPVRYSGSTLKEVAANYQKLKNAFESLYFRRTDMVAGLPEDEYCLVQLGELGQRFITEMDDGSSAANGITVVYELAKAMNQYNERTTVSEPILVVMDKLFSGWLAISGLSFENEELVDAQVDALIEERDQARRDRDLVRNGGIRNLLEEQGIVLEDTPQGIRQRRSE